MQKLLISPLASTSLVLQWNDSVLGLGRTQASVVLGMMLLSTGLSTSFFLSSPPTTLANCSS